MGTRRLIRFWLLAALALSSAGFTQTKYPYFAPGGSLSCTGQCTQQTTDLTQPSFLLGPLGLTKGGTGAATLTAHGLLLGEGTSAVSAVAAMAADTVLQGQGTSADPSGVAVTNCGDASHALAYSTSTHAFSCQAISTISTPVSAANGGTGSSTVPSSGQLAVGNAGGTAYAPATVSGDGTLASTGALSITKTGGVSFAASATTDTTNAANITSNTLAQARILTCAANQIVYDNASALLTCTATLTWNATNDTLVVGDVIAGATAGFSSRTISHEFDTLMNDTGTGFTLTNAPTGGVPYGFVGTSLTDAALWTILASNATAAQAIDPAQNILTSVKSNALTDTDGFFYLGATAGKPTGVPAHLTGYYANSVPARYDTTSNQLCFYSGSWRCVVVVAVANVSHGGTGVATLTTHGVLLGEGTSNVASVAAMALDTVLQGQGASADPAAVAVTNCGDATHALAYSTSTHTFSCQSIPGVSPLTLTTVASLPTCNAGAKGNLQAVTDATVPTYNAAAVGGGAVSVPVYCNGTAWTTH